MTFFNIFSADSSKEKPKPLIIIDHREKNSLVVSELFKKPLALEFKQLPIADYLIRDIAIERKTISDFKSSIINKRLFDQIHNLKQYPNHLLILEGILNENLYTTGMHENAFRGFMLSLALEHHLPIIFTHNSEDTAKYLCVLALKTKKKSLSSLRFSPSSLSPEQQKQFILEGFPGIGPITAQKLILQFGSLKNIFSADIDSLKKLIGKKAEAFYDMLITNNINPHGGRVIR